MTSLTNHFAFDLIIAARLTFRLDDRSRNKKGVGKLFKRGWSFLNVFYLFLLPIMGGGGASLDPTERCSTIGPSGIDFNELKAA